MSNDNRFSTYKIDLKNGVFEADGAEDHQRLLEALKHVNTASNTPEATTTPLPQEKPKNTPKNGFKLVDLVENYLKLKKQLSTATALAYRNTAKEFQSFVKNINLEEIQESDVIRYQHFLAEKGNSPRTIDNKITNLSSMFNFAIKQKLYREENPAKQKMLMTKKQKLNTGYSIFEREEIKQIFDCEFLKVAKEKDEDYYYILLLALFTGCRIGELTTLKREQIKQTDSGTMYIKIRDSKTHAGIREVPIYDPIFTILEEFLKSKTDKIFKYIEREGKGSGNAAGKKFSRHLQEAKITREKLVFHSLRKFVNNELLKNKVSIEIRSQFIGHELDNVNVNTYSNLLNVDELAKETEKTFKEIAKLIFYVSSNDKILRTEF